MSDEKKTPTIVMYFNWKSFQPDVRPYKPSNPFLEVGGYFIALDVPLTPDLIRNSIAIMGQQLSNQTEEQPILTPLGMRYIIDQFEDVMSNKTQKDTTESTNDDEWAEVEEESPRTSSPKTEDEKWDESETDEPEVEKPDDNWEEDWS